jgi:hypothetical protein
VEKRLVDVGSFLREDIVARGDPLKGWVDRGRRAMDGVMEARRTRQGRGLASRWVKRRFDRLSRREVIFFFVSNLLISDTNMDGTRAEDHEVELEM